MAVEHSQCDVTLSLSLFLSPWQPSKSDLEIAGGGTSGLIQQASSDHMILAEGRGDPHCGAIWPLGPTVLQSPAALLGFWSHLGEIHYEEALSGEALRRPQANMLQRSTGDHS